MVTSTFSAEGQAYLQGLRELEYAMTTFAEMKFPGFDLTERKSTLRKVRSRPY